jgi:hypothetical protein
MRGTADQHESIRKEDHRAIQPQIQIKPEQIDSPTII